MASDSGDTDRPAANRREFLKRAGLVAGAVAAGGVTGGETPGSRAGRHAAIIADPADPVASSAPARWAAATLAEGLSAAGIPCRIVPGLEAPGSRETAVLAAGPNSRPARELLAAAGIPAPSQPEALALLHGRAGGRPVTLACGADARGLTYALLDLADRAAFAAEPTQGLRPHRPVAERPANAVRSVARLFVSDVEDKPWFHDRGFWGRYLSMLAAQRFNRFSLTFGIGYDFLGEVRDSYLHFAYPFLLAVPGYQVRASGLPDAERDLNLAMLRYVSEEAVGRGLHFQLGLWTHGYDWSKNTGVNHFVEGLTPANHAAYCRDALRLLLEECPAIGGVTFRVHGESGIPEATYAFWRTVFDGVARCGRQVEIDMHAKGIDAEMIDVALATGMPVTVSPKYWAEHLGLPYHQAAIRALEMPPRGRGDEGFFARSSGSRSFLRYGYGDLLAEDRRYRVLHRIWPGTQRLLLWGDAAFAAAYGRAAGFCGSAGIELCEPLSFKGRKGSGLPGGRQAYAGPTLRTEDDWAKYAATYHLWGRALYDPATPAEALRRPLRAQYGEAASSCEAALACASRILPLLTTAHLPSAANAVFWPELYTNMPIVDAERPHPYGDTPSPRRFGTVSPLDPALFCTIEEYAEALLRGRPGARYTPAEVAAWLEGLAEKASRHLAEGAARAGASPTAAFQRLAADVTLQAGLGRFFAHKLRSGVYYALYERTGDAAALDLARDSYGRARRAWEALSAAADGVYVRDITFGSAGWLRGHWRDRLAAIDADIADMAGRSAFAATSGASASAVRRAVRDALRLARPRVSSEHAPPAAFRRGEPVTVDLAPARGAAVSGLLRYRHVNQGELYQTVDMERSGDRLRGIIPGAYTDSPYPLLYFAELRDGPGREWLYPGLNAELTNQPYFVVRQEGA